MPITRNQVIAVLGGAVVFFAIFGLMEVGSRAGPFEEELQNVALPLSVTWTLARSTATGTTGPGGVCVPTPPATDCAPARTRIDLTVDGLPVLGASAGYQVWLASGAERFEAGSLTSEGAVHHFSIDEEVDTTEFTQLLVTAEASTEASEGPILYHDGFSRGGGTVHVEETAAGRLSAGDGSVVLQEIGGVAISTTADVSVADLPRYPGWTYRAWLVDETGVFTDLGHFQPDTDGQATFDARVELLPLEDQDRFLIMLEPAEVASDTPVGLPVLQATLEAPSGQ